MIDKVRRFENLESLGSDHDHGGFAVFGHGLPRAALTTALKRFLASWTDQLRRTTAGGDPFWLESLSRFIWSATLVRRWPPSSTVADLRGLHSSCEAVS
jgi:hypothetical protein